DTPRVLVTTALGLIQRTIPRDLVREATVCLTQGDHVSPGALASRLERAGYDRVPLVEDPGTFAVRGDIVDVWSPGLEHPVRLDLSFEELDSIRSFSAESQRSRPGNELSRVRLLPAREALITQESAARAVARMRALCDAKNV